MSQILNYLYGQPKRTQRKQKEKKNRKCSLSHEDEWARLFFLYINTELKQCCWLNDCIYDKLKKLILICDYQYELFV